ncbi:transporter, major facilitator family protein [Aeromicrobium marinum DSM 15272]|uniref:Transporter, major facilitator family protein n=1 Tax=Aeromicrobium marinum DSM 15272 TaxID=585531 RepID=E2S8V3_9ACTN|nr:MFS transporter [Aeromicrobium marinum]EFQ84608.1 transporter, major facilitator family protein [Aeromicrobium marinum DSM 15272]
MTTTTRDLTPTRATARDWLALAVLMLPVLLVSVDNTVLSFALPEISTELRPTGSQLLWIVDVYALMLAGLLIAMGSLGDRIGRRRLLLVGAAGFGAASVVAAFSPSAEALLVARAMLGFFGAMLMPSTLSLIRNVFLHPHDRRLAIATWAAMFSGGAALGPILGGVLLEHFWWGSVFLINAPVVLVFVPLAVVLLPESRDPRPGPVDLPSIVLSLLAMLPVVYGIKHLAKAGVDDVTLLSFGVGLGCAVLFVRRQQRLASPMVDVTLFTDPVFSGAIVANLLSLMGLAGFLFFGAQLLQLVLGLSPLASALVLLPGLVVTVAGGFMAVRLVRVVPVRVLVSLSFVASSIGYAIAAFTGQPTVTSVLVAFAVMGLGIGIAETLTNDLVLSSVPPHKAGAASAISETAYEVGAVLGTAVLGSVLTATYRGHLQVPPMFATDSAAYETLGSTLEQASRLSAHLGGPLAESAREAFDLGVQRASGVAIVVALLAAAVSWRTLANAPR